jgi:hypothetical protein
VRRRFLFVVLALLLALAAGCSGDDPPSLSEYEAEVISTRDRVDAALENVTQAESRDDLLDRMDDAAANIDRAADDLDETGAADGFDDETEKLVDALHQLAVDLEATANTIREPGFEDLLNQTTRGLSFQSWTDANAVLTGLAKQGIDVEPIARH